jgi:hypothetical protein
MLMRQLCRWLLLLRLRQSRRSALAFRAQHLSVELQSIERRCSRLRGSGCEELQVRLQTK